MDKTVALPRHEVLSADEVVKLLEQYNISKTELPRIKKTDPGLKGLDVKVGDVVKITRRSPTAGTAFYYRLVVD